MGGGRLWPPCNRTVIPTSEPRISIYVVRNVRFTFATGVGVHFINTDFWKPGKPQSENACGLLLCTGLRYPRQPPQLPPCRDDPKANQSAKPIRMMATMYGNAWRIP